jgi:hypothetical protein
MAESTTVSQPSEPSVSSVAKSQYSAAATATLQDLSRSLHVPARLPLHCPRCNEVLQIQYSGRNGRWSARHSSRPCDYSLGCWGNAETEDELHADFRNGATPRLSNAATRHLIEQWIERICLIVERRREDQHGRPYREPKQRAA